MPQPFALYASVELPTGFRYPTLIQQHATTGSYPNIAPWWFIDADSRAGRLAFSIRTHDGRNLVPFAKVDDGRGDLACFDGDDDTGSPSVRMLVLDESGRRYGFADFAEWLAAAQRDGAD